MLQTLKSRDNSLSTHTSEIHVKRYLKKQVKSDYIHDSEPANVLVLNLEAVSLILDVEMLDLG